MPLTINVYDIDEQTIALYGIILLSVAGIQCRHLFILRGIQKSIFMHREGNMTDVSADMYINIPYEDCRCNVVSIESCLTDMRLKYTRILPLISFTLEIYILKDILSLKYYRRCFRNLYWISSTFLFFCLLVFIYRSSYDYDLIALFLSCVALKLFFCCVASKVNS